MGCDIGQSDRSSWGCDLNEMEPHANQRGMFQAGGEAGVCSVWQL